MLKCAAVNCNHTDEDEISDKKFQFFSKTATTERASFEPFAEMDFSLCDFHAAYLLALLQYKEYAKVSLDG